MSDGFTKLFSSIVTSSIWCEDNNARILWITMLALSDADGFVAASLPGLANVARLSVEDTVVAIDKLKSPDPYSRTKENEGRRISDVEGGWLILNYRIYRSRAMADHRKEYKRNYMREHMQAVRHTLDNDCLTESNDGKLRSNHLLLSSDNTNAVNEGGCRGVEISAEHIYAEYPKHIGRPAALRAIDKALRSVSAPELLKLTAAYAKAVKGAVEDRFIPHPSTWFNQERYHDDPSTWTPRKSTGSRFD